MTDTHEVGGSTPSTNTKKRVFFEFSDTLLYLSYTNGAETDQTAISLVRDKQWAYTHKQRKNINGENVDSPAFAYAVAA